MKQYLFLFRGGLNMGTATQEQLQEAMDMWKQWMDDLAGNGRLAGNNRLQKAGRLLTGKRKEITDGPYLEGKEIVGGYVIVHATDLDEATKLATGCPIFHYDGSVEVREIMQM